MDEAKQPLLPRCDGASPSFLSTQYSSIQAEKYDGHEGSLTDHGVTLPQKSEVGEPQSIKDKDDHQEDLKVYKRRWYILILFSLLAATQGAIWNTFGPISSSSQDAFGWHNADIALLSDWGPISYIISGIFFSWMMNVKGLRPSCVLTMFLIALGASVRCITMEPPLVTWMMNIGQMLNGLGGPVAMAGAPVISSVWFPSRERTTATAVGTIMASFGTGASFLIGPLIVPDVPDNTSTTSTTSTTSSPISSTVSILLREDGQHTSSLHALQYSAANTTILPPEVRIANEKKAIHLLMYIEAAWAIGLFLLMLIYFPSKPPLPPCTSAALQREDFLVGLKRLAKRPQFWLVVVIYGVSTGVNNCWASVLDMVLSPHGIGEMEAGWMGFYSICASSVVTIVVAWFADHISRILKWLVFVFYALSTGAFAVFTLACINVVPSYTAVFYVSIIVGSITLNTAVPLLYELSCELAYPTGEATSNGIMTIANNFVGLIFLFVLMDPNVGTMWTNWTMVGTIGICIPMILAMKESYNRLDVDEVNPTMASINVEITVPDPPPSVQAA
ncbi:disrupted in renal carcinoma protein 2-like [Pomacea canaliculata]|uniref:disrupted in renal carcinoma protein 2-like n=1 Tax=Pomacea canaliculata TaxID=400727 RepID=UPI000D7341F5|nr:disrupted in renal carcinoma protein 2-like [Pomacea canaliculata]XP_025082548.1 disrupted in renal carcinoma protein 2-like [Pomacea canaliculata]XP_025082549.1 disrupted in renal carcinoma protein 2-like [Pomacea canaliculata]